MDRRDGGRGEVNKKHKKKNKITSKAPRHKCKGTLFYYFVTQNRQSIMLLYLFQCLFEVSTYKVALLVQGKGVTWPITLGEGLGWRAKLTMGIKLTKTKTKLRGFSPRANQTLIYKEVQLEPVLNVQ